MSNSKNFSYSRWYLGVGRCASPVPGLYTNVAYFTRWILFQLNLIDIRINENDILGPESFHRNWTIIMNKYSVNAYKKIELVLFAVR